MDYTLHRSRRRSLSVEVTAEATVVVRAPIRMPQATIDAFIAQKRPWIEGHLQRRRAYNDAHPPLTAEEVATLRRRAKAYLPQRIQYWAGVMGLETPPVKITAARKRYGSCSSRGSLCFSLYLMAHSAEAIDAVVVHELCHLRHMSHSPAFYAEVERWMPDYRARAKELKV